MNFFGNLLRQFQLRKPDALSQLNKANRNSDQNSDSMISGNSNGEYNPSECPNFFDQRKHVTENSQDSFICDIVGSADSCNGVDSNVGMLCNMEEKENINKDPGEESINIEKYLKFYELEKLPAVDDKASCKNNKGSHEYLNEVNDLEDIDIVHDKLCNTQQDWNKPHTDNGTVSIYDDSKLNEEIDTSKFDSELLRNENLETNVENNLTVHHNNIEIISISSDEEDCILRNKPTNEKLNASPQRPIKNKIEIDTHSDCSYNSSDFEFITEGEAVLQGLSTEYFDPEPSCSNFISGFSTMPKKHSTCKVSNENEVKVNENSSRKEGPVCSMRNFIDFDSDRPKSFSDGTDSIHHPNNLYHRDSFRPSNVDFDHRPLHNAIPEGEGYLDLFRGIYDPIMPLASIHMMENKSVRSTSMNVEFEGIGFDMQLMRNMDDSSQEEYESEAQEVANEILRRHPVYNRKRRRRY